MLDDLMNWAENSMSLGFFLILGVVFLILLVVAFILDGAFELFDLGDGPLSLTTLAAFGTLFGFSGFAAMGFGASTGVATLVGAIIGAIGGVGAWGLSWFFKKSSTSSTVSVNSVQGAEATVTLRIPGGDTPGEIAHLSSGMRHSYIAYARTPIQSGETVIIETIRGGNAVNVKPLQETETTPEPETTS